ncbi:hypothetical protein LTR28_003997 [Elasticomyces elasticus]|nr:hypothetical protein LTR28_003997 [Elasticomyces elasticus]
MTSSVASKNTYELLGNDPELDSDREPEPPTKVVDKPVQRTGKRNSAADGHPKDAPKPAGGARGGRQEAFTGSEHEPNEHRDAGSRGRGSRGGRGFGGRGNRAARDDRHDHSGIGEHAKQAAHGWGAETGPSEWEDEKAGEAMAKEEEKDRTDIIPDAPVDAEGHHPGDEAAAAAAEPEDKSKSYEQYLAELMEKKAALGGGTLEARKANEGSTKKFPEGKAVTRVEEENFIAGSGGKAKRERERKQKNTLDIDQTWVESEGGDRGGFRGGRGGRGRGRGDGFRGDRGGRGRGRGDGFRGDRGGARGDRGDRGFRGERGDRGDRGDRSDRGPRPQQGTAVDLSDNSAFPSLGK